MWTLGWLVGSVSLLVLPVAPSKTPAAGLSQTIDRILAQRWEADGVRPAPLAEDHIFVRRVYLDLAGHIPAIYEVRDFLDDPALDKRARLIEHLLAAPDYSNHFAHVWRAILLPGADSPEKQFLTPNFEEWLRKRLQENVGYDRLVREMLTETRGDNSPAAFFNANDNNPEMLAAATARLFMGIKLECAQCHDHPHARWTQQQFWEYAAYFRTEPTKLPKTDKVLTPRVPTGLSPKSKAGTTARQALAEWLTSGSNPLLARAAVNRLWDYFLGAGLVEPVDETGDGIAASHPELLDRLAGEFAAHQYDVKFLIRAIANSQAYQRSSTPLEHHQHEPQLFDHMAVRALSAEQLFDSVCQATGTRDQSVVSMSRTFPDQPPTPRGQFLATFANQEKRTEARTSILQALHLMNSRFMTEVTSPERSEVLATIANAASLSTTRRVEELFLNTLSRKPHPDETARLVKYVEAGERRKTLADVFWALLNSSEFMLNH
jgi:hypothetical protein